MEASDTLTPVSGICTLPSDYLSLRRLYLDSVEKVELQQLSPEQFYEEYPVAVGGARYYCIEGSNIVLADDTDGYDVKILYYQQIPVLSVSNTTNWLLDTHPDLYLAATLSIAYDVMKKPQDSQMWYQKAAIIVGEIMDVDKRGKYSGSALRVIAS